MSEFTFGSDKIVISKGAKATRDYLVFHNGNQITDKSLFEHILLNTSNEKEAKMFIGLFAKCICINFKKDRIETNLSPLERKKIYDYCINSKLNSELQKFLFITILRCDIDNINYPPPKNGCIRIFVQVLLLFSYKFKWTTYINKNNIPPDIAQYIYDIGFKKDIKSIIYFREIYERYLKKGI